MTRLGGPTRWRRRVITLAVLSIVLGFVTTWVVAWTCGVYVTARHETAKTWEGPDQVEPSWSFQPSRRVTVSHGFGVERLNVILLRRENNELSPDWLRSGGPVPKWSRTYASWSVGEPRPAATREIEAPGSRSAFDPDFPALLMTSWSEACYGWPLPCLNCSWPRAEKVRDAFIPPRWLRETSKRERYAAFPYRPYWSALICNTIFYTAFWALMLVAPRTTRRIYRRLRRRCPNCGYDIRHCEDPGCPECGWGRQMPDSTDSDETPPATMLP